MIKQYFKESQGYDCHECPVGFILYRVVGPELHLGHMWVEPSARKSGAAQQMTTDVIALGKERGCTIASCVVTCDGSATSTRLVRIYAEYGFIIVSADQGAIIMTKEIN
jgi:ribosomal protein S18 acetylase RimI-like enzyme